MTINGKPFSTPRNINLRGGIIRFDAEQTSNPLDSTSNGLYVNSSNQLIFSSQGTTTIMGAAGEGVTVPSFEQLFGADNIMVVSGTTFTVRDAGTSTNDILTVEATAAMSGDIIKINNAGSGKDISGAGDTWSFTKAGVLTCTDIDTPLITSTAALTIAVAGSSAITIGTGSNTITMAKATTFSTTTAFSGNMTATNVSTILTSNSNTVAPLLITNNTVTTFGTAVSEGVAVIRSTSLTTGTLLKLQLGEDQLNGGFYLEAYDTNSTEKVFTIGENGAVVITGAASTTMLTISAGNQVITAGNLTLTSGNAVLTSGNLTLTAGSATLTSGNLKLTSGNATLTSGNLTLTAGSAILSSGNLKLTSGTLTLTSGSETITAGDLIITLGSARLTEGNLVLTAGSATLTSGNLVLTSGNATLTSGNLTLTSGNETITAGDLIVTLGSVRLTEGNLVLTAGSATLTSGNLVLTSGSETITSGNLTLTAGNLVLTAGTATVTSGDIVLSANASKIIFTGTGSNGGVLKNLKNSANQTATGTAKTIELDIAGTPYYFLVYPTSS